MATQFMIIHVNVTNLNSPPNLDIQRLDYTTYDNLWQH